jgi:phosphate-selective porin OprO/OprP
MNIMRTAAVLMAVLLVTCTLASSVSAQGTFYVEVAKNGRIFVFNNMKVYDDWQKSGEVEKSITKIGEGPNGETMVFDSQEAVHLYNFKHDRPAEVFNNPVEKEPKMSFGWKDGKTTWESDNASLILSNRMQFRDTVEDPEDGDVRGSFRIRRAKTKLEGWFIDPNLTYEFQVNWADITNALEDVVLQYDVTRGPKLFMVKIGQFKVPFGRQELTSSGSQEFVDRSIVSNEFARGRDIGVQLWGLPLNGKIDWRVGVFNGAGRNRTSNDNNDYQYDARLTWQPWGDVKYSEVDFDSTDKPLIAFAGQFEQNTFMDATTTLNVDRRIWGGDVAFKYKGVFAFFEGFQRKIKPEATGISFDSPGYAGQLGYLFKKKLDVAVRYATFDPTDITGGDDRNERGVAVGYYWNKHNLKWQGDFRQLENEADDETNNEFRTQVQFIF